MRKRAVGLLWAAILLAGCGASRSHREGGPRPCFGGRLAGAIAGAFVEALVEEGSAGEEIYPGVTDYRSDR